MWTRTIGSKGSLSRRITAERRGCFPFGAPETLSLAARRWKSKLVVGVHRCSHSMVFACVRIQWCSQVFAVFAGVRIQWCSQVFNKITSYRKSNFAAKFRYGKNNRINSACTTNRSNGNITQYLGGYNNVWDSIDRSGCAFSYSYFLVFPNPYNQLA